MKVEVYYHKTGGFLHCNIGGSRVRFYRQDSDVLAFRSDKRKSLPSRMLFRGDWFTVYRAAGTMKIMQRDYEVWSKLGLTKEEEDLLKRTYMQVML